MPIVKRPEIDTFDFVFTGEDFDGKNLLCFEVHPEDKGPQLLIVNALTHYYYIFKLNPTIRSQISHVPVGPRKPRVLHLVDRN